MTEVTESVQSMQTTQAEPGRVCPLRYRYGASAIARAEPRVAQTLYVIGGLYGNVPALDAIEQMAAAESAAPTLCFNGDFNWFNIDDHQFTEINRRVLAHDAIQGNVEAEFDAIGGDTGCGCAYPDSVDSGIVERSNFIHAQLKATALRRPELTARINRLPMFARYQVGDCRVGVVHGDADSLAGWRFDVRALDDPSAASWLRAVFRQGDVDLFASTHTCLPALRAFALTDVMTNSARGWVVNNGASGMPNFAGDMSGLCTRIGLMPSPHEMVHEVRVAGAYVSLLPVRFDAVRWHAEFLRQWPDGSPAWTSYWERIANGPMFWPEQVVNSDRSTRPTNCADAIPAEPTRISSWPDSTRPRSATVVTTKIGGGIIGS